MEKEEEEGGVEQEEVGNHVEKVERWHKRRTNRRNGKGYNRRRRCSTWD